MAKRGQYKKNAKADSVRQRKYNSSPEQKKRRAQRNKIRRKLEREGKVRKGDGKDVDHRNHNTSDMSSDNISIMDRSSNRAKNQWDKRKRKKK
jgi:hypothetical protein